MRKDIKWMLPSIDCVVKNVPVIELDGEEFLDINTSIVLSTLSFNLYHTTNELCIKNACNSGPFPIYKNNKGVD